MAGHEGKNIFDYTAYVYLTDRSHIKSVLDYFQGKRSPAVNIEKDNGRFPGMEGFRKCFKCGASDHEARNCRDLCLRLVLLQEINWTYAKHRKEITGADKITVGADCKLGLVTIEGRPHAVTFVDK